MKIINSPITKTNEINAVNQMIDRCEFLDDTRIACEAIDMLEKNQPHEKEIIYNMRQVLADISFVLFEKQKQI